MHSYNLTSRSNTSPFITIKRNFIADCTKNKLLRTKVSAAPAGTDMEGIAASGQALTVRYIQKPQDGSADTVIRAGLSPSYVTYNASTVQKVSAFFKTGQVRLPVLRSLGGSPECPLS